MEEISGNQLYNTALSWDTCPTEILVMIFEKLPASTLANCMFVNSRWRTLVEHVVNYHNMWQEIVGKVMLCKGEELKLKSKLTMDWQQIHYNHVLWNNLPKSSIDLLRVHKENNIKIITIYRDNLIVVTYKNVKYYAIDSLELQKTLEVSCRDYMENDFMILIAHDSFDRYRKLRLYKKATKDDFNLDPTNVKIVEKVLCYKYHNDRAVNNRCYVLDYVNNLIVCGVFHPDWVELFTGRYYGSPHQSCFLNVFDEEVFLMLKSGTVLWVDENARNFKKILSVPVPLFERSDVVFCKMFHKFGFVFGVAATEKFVFERYNLSKNNIFLFKCPSLSCVTRHNEIIIFGYLNGMVEFFMPRLLSTTEPLRRFNLKELKADVKDLEVVSIDVHEDHGFHHLFVATLADIFHLHITYPDCEDFMWNEFPEMCGITVAVALPTSPPPVPTFLNPLD